MASGLFRVRKNKKQLADDSSAKLQQPISYAENITSRITSHLQRFTLICESEQRFSTAVS